MKEKLKLLILKIKNSLLRVFVFGKGNTAIKVLAPIALVLVFVLVPMHSAHAAGVFDAITSWVGNTAKEAIVWFIGWLIGDIFIPLMGAIMIWITKGIVLVAGYNGFGTATAVTVGWVLLRDMANMIFVIALLMMAFGTMLDIESMGNSKQLPRLLVMAVAVNFSKMLTLFLIDISQVVMLTFVAAFRATAAGNFVKAFGITDWFTKIQNSDGAADHFAETIISMLLAAILVVVATGVLIVFLSFLVIRMVTLWMLIIFSPLAFGLSVLAKKGKSYYDKWWDELVKTLITGPLIAFFLWLTLATAGASAGIGTEIIANSRNVSENPGVTTDTNSNLGQHGTKALQTDVLITFVVSIAMLMLGLQITQEVGAAGIGKAMAFKDKTMKFAGGIAKKSALWTGKKVGGVAYNAKIPFSGGASLAGVVAGAGAGIAGSKFGKAVGLNKEYTDLQRAEKKAAGLRMMGQDTKARALEQATISEHQKKLAPLTQDQVEKKLKEMRQKGDTGSLEYKAMGLDLASRGYYSTNHSSLDKVAAGDADYKKDLIKIANEKGANYVDVKGGDPATAVRDMMAGKSDNDLRSMFANIEKGVQISRDIDGNETTADPHAVQKLLNLDKKTFDSNQFGEAARKKVQDGLLLAMENATQRGDSSEVDKLNGQLLNLTNVNPTDTAKLNEFSERGSVLFNEQQKKLTESYTSELRKEKGNVSSIDQELINGANVSMDPTDRASIRSTGDELQTLTNNLSTPTHIRDAETDTARLENELRAQYRKLDAKSLRTGKTDPSGNEMTYEQVYDESTLNKSIGQMREKLRDLQAPGIDAPQNASKKAALQKEIASIQSLISSMTQQMMTSGRGRSQSGGTRATYEKVVTKQMPKMDSRISNHVSNAKSQTDATEKQKQIILARQEMEKAIQTLTAKEMGLAEAVKRDLQVLKANIGSFKKTMNDGRTDNLNAKLDGLKRLHEEYEKLRKKT